MMDTKNWFGEHAHTVRMFALIGGVVLAAIILFDILAGKKHTSGATGANGTAADTAASGATSSLNPGETNISVFEDYSNHTDTVTSNQYAPPPFPRPHIAPSDQLGTLPVPRYEGGPVPVPTPHTNDQYGSPTADFDWRELTNWTRSA